MSEPLERFWVQIPFKFPTIQNFIGVIIVLYFKPHADQARAHIVHKTKKEYDTTACKKKNYNCCKCWFWSPISFHIVNCFAWYM